MKQKSKGNFEKEDKILRRNSQKFPNIIWFHLDGIRPNRNFGDHKDKPYFLDNFAKEGIEYTNVCTAAGNTVMSMSSMITGYPSVYIARSFNEFKFDKREFKSLFTILKENGYDVYFLSFARFIRRVFKKAMYSLPIKYYPFGINEYKYKWNSGEMNRILRHFLKKKKLQKPYLLYLHYSYGRDIKKDSSLKDSRKMFNYLKKRGFFEDSIVIIWSDHGWPAPVKEKGRGRLDHALEGHDLILTDDNVKVPIVIKYPGCKKGLKINDLVYTLDLGPTLLEILGIKTKFGNSKFCKTLPLKKKLINWKNRYLRIDTRYFFQNSRKSGLTDRNYKYICYFEGVHNCTKEILYDLRKDPNELVNLFNNKKYLKVLNRFRKELIAQEKEVYNYHVQYLTKKLSKKLPRSIFPAKRITIVASQNILFSQAISDVLKGLITDAQIKIISSENIVKKLDDVDLIVFALDSPFLRYKKILRILKRKKINYFYLDQNFDFFTKCTPFSYILENLKLHWRVYLKKPKLFFHWLVVFYLRSTGKVA